MPFIWNVDADRRLVRLVYRRSASPGDWIEAIDAVLADPAYEPGFGWLVDRRGAASVTTEFARTVQRHVEKRHADFRGCRVAILVNPTSSTDYGMGRMQEMLNESAGLPTRTFDSEFHALAWLGVSSPGDTS